MLVHIEMIALEQMSQMLLTFTYFKGYLNKKGIRKKTIQLRQKGESFISLPKACSRRFFLRAVNNFSDILNSTFLRDRTENVAGNKNGNINN